MPGRTGQSLGLSDDGERAMKCEICDIQTATMWVLTVLPSVIEISAFRYILLSCADCVRQLGYKILAPLEPVTSD